MKSDSILTLLLTAAALLLAPTAHAADDHDGHDHADHSDADHGHTHEKKIAGPNGGRVLHSVEPHLEFFVMKDRRVKITAVDDEGKAVTPGELVVSLCGVDRMNPTRMSFSKDGDALVSDKPFPEGNDFPVVLLIKVTPGAKTVYERFNLNLGLCPECKHAEYACICEHGEESHDDHKH